MGGADRAGHPLARPCNPRRDRDPALRRNQLKYQDGDDVLGTAWAAAAFSNAYKGPFMDTDQQGDGILTIESNRPAQETASPREYPTWPDAWPRRKATPRARHPHHRQARDFTAGMTSTTS